MARCSLPLLWVLLLAVGHAGAHTVREAGARKGFLTARGAGAKKGRMMPEVVAETLADVDDEWVSMADSFLACRNSNSTTGESPPCADVQQKFSRSCATVVSAMVQGSGGQPAVVGEYMRAVCRKGPLAGWRQHQCLTLASFVDGAMSMDPYHNRELVNTAGLCQRYWSNFTAEESVIIADRLAEEQAREAAEAAERKKKEEAEAEARKQREAAEAEAKKKREEAEAEARKQKAEADEKAQAEAVKQARAKAAADAKAKAEAARLKAEQAKVAAEEAAKHLEAKRAEAEKEAQVAAEEAKEASEVLNNNTAPERKNATAPGCKNATAP